MKLYIYALLCLATSISCSFQKPEKAKFFDLTIAVDRQYFDFFQEMIKEFSFGKDVRIRLMEVDMFANLDTLEKNPEQVADIFFSVADRLGLYATLDLLEPLENLTLRDFTHHSIIASRYQDTTYMLPMSVDTTLLIYDANRIVQRPKTLTELPMDLWATNFTDFYFMFGLFMSLDPNFLNKQHQLNLLTEEATTVGSIIQQWHSQHSPLTRSMSKENANISQLLIENFLNGEIVYMINGSWSLSAITGKGLNIDAMPIPSWDGTNSFQQLVGVKGLVVNAKTTNKQLAKQFLQFLSTYKNAQTWYQMTKEISPHRQIPYLEGSIARSIFDAAEAGVVIPNDIHFFHVWEPMNHALQRIVEQADIQATFEATQKELLHIFDAMES
ncbi:extracellular solute-binding protein [Entomospira entomophila]|uniref:Extracellular solute-binding protein n=1 Tax=Entomospira entomophila TaxID=2719988 RepID=A0A968KW13_9SPIO|nr:extracellular solute-binding protein [Entomospira entomophilus]NIZ40395.1 extracellular solute-binding protein [Entomospira entomophilus]WDI35954.1 extracellular solute-binding protein [Entomospira entomophilus]